VCWKIRSKGFSLPMMGRIISSFHATMSLNRAFENFDHIITALFAAIAVYQFFYGQHMRVVLAVVATTYPFPPL